MDAQGWVTIIGALTLAVLQILNWWRVYQLELVTRQNAAKSSVERAETRDRIVEVAEKVDGRMESMIAEMAVLNSTNATLREVIATAIERDARSAQTAREAGAR